MPAEDVPTVGREEVWAEEWPAGRRYMLDGERDTIQVRRAVDAAGRLLGRRVTAHLLRHSWATWLAAQGVPLE